MYCYLLEVICDYKLVCYCSLLEVIFINWCVIASTLLKVTRGYKLVCYCSLLEITDPKNDVGPFLVTLQQTESLSFYGPCQIEIQPKPSERAYYVAVYDMNQPARLIIRWQIDHLRGYGSNESVLKVQTGR